MGGANFFFNVLGDDSIISKGRHLKSNCTPFTTSMGEGKLF